MLRLRVCWGLSAVLLLLAACTSTVANSTGTPGEAAGPGSAAVNPTGVPAGLEHYYEQSLTWAPCDDYATQEYHRRFYPNPLLECARLQVPLDYADLGSPVLSLAVMRRAATDRANRIGVAVPSMGVSNSGLDLVAMASGLGAADLNKQFDLVGFDQRGMGSSGPRVECLSEAAIDAMRSTSVRTRTDADVEAANAEVAGFSAACTANTAPPDGVDTATYLAHIGTREAAKDLDILRAALGEEQLSLIGYSYGTRVARAYTREFTDRVRALILDGIFPSGVDQAAELHSSYAAIQQAFEDYTQWCTGMSSCQLSADPAAATAAFQALTRPLLEAPLPLNDGRTLGYDDAIAGTLSGLGAQTQWSPLNGALLSLVRGHGEQLMDLADRYWARYDGEYWADLSASAAVSCVDGPAPPTGAEADAIAADAVATAPILDNGDPPRATEFECHSWPGPPTLDPPATAIPGLPPTLIISTVGDMWTPHQFGIDLAESLGAPLLTVEGTDHTAYLGNTYCVNDVGTAFLTTLQPPPAGTTC